MAQTSNLELTSGYCNEDQAIQVSKDSKVTIPTKDVFPGKNHSYFLV